MELRFGAHRKVAAPIVVVATIPAVGAILDFGGLAGLRVLVLAVVALVVFWVFAAAFDHRWLDPSFGRAVLRLLPIAFVIIVGLFAFADPWVYSFGITASTPAFSVLMVIELAAALWVWFHNRSRAVWSSPTLPSPPNSPPYVGAPPTLMPPPTLAPTVDASSQRPWVHLASGGVFAVILVFGGVFFGALASYCSGDGRSFYAIVVVASLAGALVVACAAWMDRRFSTGGVALAMGRMILVGIAATILVFVVLAAIPLPPADCN